MANDRDIENGMICDPSYPDVECIGHCYRCMTRLYADEEEYTDNCGNTYCDTCYEDYDVTRRGENEDIDR